MGKKTKTREQLDAIGRERLSVNNDPNRGRIKLGNTKDVRLYKGELLPDDRIRTSKKHDGNDPIYHLCLAEDEVNTKEMSDWSVEYGVTHDTKNIDVISREAAKHFGCVTRDMFTTSMKHEWDAVKERIKGKIHSFASNDR